MRRGRRWLGLLVALTVVPVPAGAAIAQAGGPPRYTFYSVSALADGVTAEFEIDGFLPVDQLVGIASVTSEAHFGLGRADGLAALPDPGELVLTLPGTLSGLSGIPGIPGYPAAAYAEHPQTPEDEVVVAPDGGLGAGTLRASAAENGSNAEAFVGNLVDTVGLLPTSFGSSRTTATTRRLDAATFESNATSTVSDLRVLGGVLRIDEITSVVTTRVVDGRLTADASEVTVSGAELAGTPVGITHEGIVALGQPQALDPVIAPLREPLDEAGLRITTTPSREEVTDTRAVAHGGSLRLEVPLSVQGYPGTFVLTVAGATSDLEIGGLTTSALPPVPAGLGAAPTTGSSVGTGSGSGAPASAGTTGSGARASTSSPRTGSAASSGASGGSTNPLVVIPGSRTIANWDVLPLYRAMLAAGVAMFLAGRAVNRARQRASRRATELRPLWRW